MWLLLWLDKKIFKNHMRKNLTKKVVNSRNVAENAEEEEVTLGI